MKNKTIISIALLILVITPLVSASIGGGRSIPNPLTRSKLNHPQEEDISEGFNSVINLIQNNGEPLNISEEEKEDLRLRNNFLIAQKNNPELVNLTYEQYLIKEQEEIFIFNDDVNNEFVLFIFSGIILLIFFIWLTINERGNGI